MPSALTSRGRWHRLALALIASVVLATLGSSLGARTARAEVTTISQDSMRTAWDAREPGLGPAAVSAADFGKLFTSQLDGQVYAQPLVVNGRLIAATENNKVYGLDPVDGHQLWVRNLGPAWPAATVGCGVLAPNVGVTATPVYDAATNSVYLTAKVNDGPDATQPHWYMHALDPGTGLDRPGWPVSIRGAPTNDPAHPFNAERALQRAGLLLMGGRVYAAFASHCDLGPYVGYVVSVDTAPARVGSMWSTEAGSSYAEAGIWQSGGGLVSDSPGNIYLATGNGVSPPPGPGTTPPSTLAESVVHLRVGPDGSMTAVDFFSPANNATLDQDDTDLGSGGPIAIPDGYGTAAHPHLLVQVGKDGRVFLLDRDSLGGTAQGAGGRDAALAVAGPYNGVWGHSAFYGAGGGYVYNVGNNGYLRSFALVDDSSGNPTLAADGISAGTFGPSSGSPVVTSDGTTPGSALVWVEYMPPSNGGVAELRAYDALPTDGVLRLRYSAPVGGGVKFGSVATDGGRVYLGNRDGQVIGFGRPTTSPVVTGTADLGTTPVGTSRAGTVSITAARPLTVTAASTAAPFTVDTSALPVTLSAGQSYPLPVTLTPTTWGPQSATLDLTTTAGPTALTLTGSATQPGLGAAPASLDFGVVPSGAVKMITVTVVNTSTTAQTISGATAPASPFSVTDLPGPTTVLQPGTSVAIPVTYSPQAAGGHHDALVVTSEQGSVTVPLTGSSVAGQAQLTPAPTVLDFGSVPVGLSSSLSFDIANTGNVGLTITKASPPALPFDVPSPVGEGQQLAPDAVIHQTVSFKPTATGSFTQSYRFTSDDGRGQQNVTVTGVGTFDPIAVKAQAIGRLLADPLTGEFAVPGGMEQRFRFGAIYWSPATGAHVVQRATYALYRQIGESSGMLGFPTSDELTVGAGRSTVFQRGRAYWSAATGAHEVHGAILADYLRLKGPTGPLGFPISDQVVTADGVGRFSQFRSGDIYWTPTTGARGVKGPIRQAWLAQGAERGRLGYPTSEEFAVTGGRRANFQHGYITNLGGRVVVHLR